MPENTATPMAWRISAPAPVDDHQRHDTHDERDRRHQDRPQPQAAGFQHGRDAVHALLLLVLGELDDEDGVLTRQAHQHDEADLGEDVVVAARPG